MEPGPGLVGAFYAVMGAAFLLLLREPLRNPGKPGSRGFAIAMIGIALWPMAVGVNYLVAGVAPSTALWNVRLFAASVVAVGWFLMALEFATGRWPSRWVVRSLLAFPFLEGVLAWTNVYHGLVLGPETTVVGTVLIADYGPWFPVHALFAYGLVLTGTALFASEWRDACGLRARQATLLTVAVLPPLATNFVTITGGVTTAYDLTPLGLVGTGACLTVALYRVEFLDVVPVARETAMGEMQDAVVTIDEKNRVVDCNRSATELFDVDEYVGTPVGAFFEPFPDDVVAAISRGSSVDGDATVRLDGERRHFSVSTSTVGSAAETDAPRSDTGTESRSDGAPSAPQVVVLRDVTALKRREAALEEREAELDLLRQVLSRVLRHNIRNKLTTIHGNARLLAEDAESAEQARRARTIVAAADELVSHSENAREIERVIEDGSGPTEVDLLDVAEDAVDAMRQQHPDVRFVVEGDPLCVEASAGLDTAVTGLVENAAAHNDAADPTVRVTVTDDPVPTLSIADNGPGIPRDELAVLDRNEETPLSHGSGVGLWLAKVAADSAGADLEFEHGSAGTVVSLAFEDARGDARGDD